MQPGQNNFHYDASNPNRSSLLMKELRQLDKGLEQNRNELQQRRLEAEFYEDQISRKPQGHNPKPDPPAENIGLADEIMNELLGRPKDSAVGQLANSPPRSTPNENSHGHLPPKKVDNFMAQEDQFFKPSSQESPKKQPNSFQQSASHHDQPPRQNSLLSKREQEIMKMQNRQEDHPFSSLDRNRDVRKQSAERNHQPSSNILLSEREQQKLKMQLGNGDGGFAFGERERSRERDLKRSLEKQKDPNAFSSHASPPPVPIYRDPRELEKIKLQQFQQNKQRDDFNERGVGIRAGYASPTKPQRDGSLSKQVAYEDRYSNPFLKDEEYIRQKKEEKQKQLRKILEEQMRAEEEKKEANDKQKKEEKYVFNLYNPGEAKLQTNESKNSEGQKQGVERVVASKKRDPNGSRPTYEMNNPSSQYISESDLNFMKSKAAETRDKYKKGRIHYDEYIVQMRKLAEYYKVDFKELLDPKDLNVDGEELPWVKDAEKKQKTLIQQNQSQQHKFEIIEHEKSLEQLPESETSLHRNHAQHSSPSKGKDPHEEVVNQQQLHHNQNPYSAFPQQQFTMPLMPPQMYTQNLSQQSLINSQHLALGSTGIPVLNMQQQAMFEHMYQEMKKMREDYTRNLESEKTLYHEFLMKFVANNMPQGGHPNKNNSDLYAEINTTNKKRSNSKSTKNERKYISESSQEQIVTDQTDDDIIERSMSGFMNKVPLPKGYEASFIASPKKLNASSKQKGGNNHKQPQNKKPEKTLKEFFSQPYKKYKHKSFITITDPTQSTFQIPSISNSRVNIKNGKQYINRMFEEDLLIMKRLQRDSQVKKLKERVDNQYNYEYANTFNQNSFKRQEESRDSKNQHANNYEQYENYQPRRVAKIEEQSQQSSKTPLVVLSASDIRKEHRTYKKAGNDSLGRQAEEENLPNFSDQSDIKVRSPVYYSPKLSSEILEQDEYQTAGKKELYEQFYEEGNMKKKNFAYEEQRESEKKQHHYSGSGEGIRNQRSRSRSRSGSRSPNASSRRIKIYKKQASPHKSNPMMSVINSNNQALSKYQVSPKKMSSPVNKDEEVDIKEYSSINSNPPADFKNYFSSQQHGSQNYDKFNSQRDFGSGSGSKTKDALKQNEQSQYEESLQTVKSEIQHSQATGGQSSRRVVERNEPKTFQNHQNQSESDWSSRISDSRQRGARNTPSINYSETIESIEESSSRVGAKPPLQKKKSTSRKKETTIARTKFEKESILVKPGRKSINDSVDAASVYEQSYDQINPSGGGQPLKFDSQVYDSEYQQSVQNQKEIEGIYRQQNMHQGSPTKKVSEPEITINPPAALNNNDSSISRNGKNASNITVNGGNKLKSLEEARKLAKECKKNSGNVSLNENKYSEKMSELESFLTKRNDGDDSMLSGVSSKREDRRNSSGKRGQTAAVSSSPNRPYLNQIVKLESPARANKKSNEKDIMNLLDDLQNQSSYKDDFESYREQSERPF